jgi:hypothetical protein
MKWTPWLFGSLTAALIAGCGGERRNDDTGTTGGAETESGTMPGDTHPGAVTGGTSDTAAAATDTSQTDTVRRNPDTTTAGSNR